MTLLLLSTFACGIGVGMFLTAALLQISVHVVNQEGVEESGKPEDDPYYEYKVGGTA